MFDVGFSEILVIAVVALIVIGPERLPKVARTLGHLFGRMQRYVTQVKGDIEREMELEELRKLQGTVQDAARNVERTFQQNMAEAEKELRQLEENLAKTGEAPMPTGEAPPPQQVAAPVAAEAEPAGPPPALESEKK
jgi:sec-independent protein translocase protein TatB